MDTEWTWAHYSDDNPSSAPLSTGEDYPTEAAARQALAHHIAALGSPHTEEALQQLRSAPTGQNVVLVVPDAVFTTRFAGIPHEDPRGRNPEARPAGSAGSPRTGSGGRDEVEALRPVDSGRARIRPKDVPVPMRVEGYLIGLCVAAGFLLTGTGIRAWARPESNVASPVLLLPGLVLFFGAFWWTSNWRRRAAARLARAGRAGRR
ncbi:MULTISPECIES: hypothetical protein [unclassified Streptomyces]|uniref:hypothetical protein n=1 Tax=unclassified Streptomyces TaxID=2593676 RepID=UPI0011E72DF2|nr:hypothetical protein [Streptomyces sp. sk2.1]TXS75671.1 hypothetical protein EAO76_13160 [Streptomyces sp. sk2.1]